MCPALAGGFFTTSAAGGPVPFSKVGMDWQIGIDVCLLPCVKQTAGGSFLQHGELGSVLCDDLKGWGWGVGDRDGQEGGGVYTHN